MVKNILKQSPRMKKAYDNFLRVLCNKTRLAIIHALMDCPKNVSELTTELNIHQTSVSHGLRRLFNCGFVTVTKKGREHYYSVNKQTIKPLIKLIEEHTEKFCTNEKCS